jgi:hypothetical protein
MPWRKDDKWATGSLIVLFPVGLYIMWRYATWKRQTKWVVTTVIITLLVIALTVVVLLRIAADPAVATWAQVLALIAAIGGIFLVWAQIRAADFHQSVTLIVELENNFSSESMLISRRVAAQHLLDEKTSPSLALTRVLNFFEMVAVMADRGAIDEVVVWQKFFTRIDAYWQATKDYREARRTEDNKLLWVYLEKLYPRLKKQHKVEHDRRGCTYTEKTGDDLEQWLKRWLKLEASEPPKNNPLSQPNHVRHNRRTDSKTQGPTAQLSFDHDGEVSLTVLDSDKDAQNQLSLLSNMQLKLETLNKEGDTLAKLVTSADGIPNLKLFAVGNTQQPPLTDRRNGDNAGAAGEDIESIGDKVKASEKAKLRAEQLEVDLSAVKGSGPRVGITVKDVERAARQQGKKLQKRPKV